MTAKRLLLLLAIGLTGAVSLPYALARDEDDAIKGREEPNLELLEMHFEMIEMMAEVCFEPSQAALIAIGGLKDEVPRKPAEIVKDLEALLGKTKTLGLRNAIRLTLKDLYKAQGKAEKVLEHLRAMVRENDAAIQAEGKK